jgi:hypothetical protein
MMTGESNLNETRPSRPRDISIVAVFMILCGIAEVMTGFAHHFFGLSTAEGRTSTYVGAAIGTLAIFAGLLIRLMTRRAVALALIAMALDVAARIEMALTGLYPTDSFRQIFGIVTGTSLVAAVGIYIGLKWQSFR